MLIIISAIVVLLTIAGICSVVASAKADKAIEEIINNMQNKKK